MVSVKKHKKRKRVDFYDQKYKNKAKAKATIKVKRKAKATIKSKLKSRELSSLKCVINPETHYPIIVGGRTWKRVFGEKKKKRKIPKADIVFRPKSYKKRTFRRKKKPKTNKKAQWEAFKAKQSKADMPALERV